MKSEINDLIAQGINVSKQRAEAQAERDELKAELKQAESEAEERQAEFVAVMNSVHKAEAERDALQVQLAESQADLEHANKVIDQHSDDATKWFKKCETLQAQLEAMRKQEPETHDAKCPALTGGDCICNRHHPVVDKAWAQFCAGVGDGPNAPYPGMIGAFERYYGQSFADKDWREESAVWAAAWKAALYAAPQPVNRRLIDALQPFVLANSSEEHITLVVRTSDITKARAAIAAAEKEMK